MPLLIGAFFGFFLFSLVIIASFIIILMEFYIANYHIIIKYFEVKEFANYILLLEKICIYTSLNKSK